MTSAAERGPKGAPPPTAPRPGLSPRARRILPLCFAVLLLLAVHRLICATPPEQALEFSGPTMGTFYSVKVAETDRTKQEEEAIHALIRTELENVNSRMSTWIPDSELSRFNAFASTQPFTLSADTLDVLRVAEAVSRQSAGAFDVTVRPLVNAWGFGAIDRPADPPDAATLEHARARVGYERIQIHPKLSSVTKARPDVECDLSAIAKGYAVDRVANALLARGHRDFLVEVGGELRASGRRLDGARWRVGIERPDTLRRSTHSVIELDNHALATSGDYRNYYERDGVRISHTIDPRSGYPIRHALASVSVLHREAVWADALATALSVLGPEAGLRWAIENEIAALFLVREADGSFRENATPGFPDAGLEREHPQQSTP